MPSGEAEKGAKLIALLILLDWVAQHVAGGIGGFEFLT
jgi:hypothetical protein